MSKLLSIQFNIDSYAYLFLRYQIHTDGSSQHGSVVSITVSGRCCATAQIVSMRVLPALSKVRSRDETTRCEMRMASSARRRGEFIE